MTGAVAQQIAAPAVDARERILDIVARLSIAGMTAAVAVFGYTAGTLRYFYPLIALSAGLYVLARGERMLVPFLHYLTSPILRWRWIFLLWAVASLFWTARTGNSVARVVTLLQIYAIGFIFYDAVRELGLGKWVLRNLFFWTTLSVLAALVTGVATAAGRLTGFYGNPNVLGLAALMGLAIFASGISLGRGAWARIAIQLAGLVLLAGLAASSSRKGFIGVPIIWLFGLISGGSRKRVVVQVVIAAALGTALVMTFEPLRILWHFTIERVADLFVSLTSRSGGTRSIVERATFVKEGFTLIGRSPLVGHGIGSFRWLIGQGKYAHNNMIDLGVGLGLIGLVLYYGLHVALVVRALFAGEAARVIRGLVLVFVPTFFILDIGVVSYYMKVPAVLFVICAAWLDRPAAEGVRA